MKIYLEDSSPVVHFRCELWKRAHRIDNLMGSAIAPLLFSPSRLFSSSWRRTHVEPSCCDRHVSTISAPVSVSVAAPANAAVKVRAKRKSWVERYEQLHEYMLVHGDVNVSRKVDPGLYEWVVRQRYKWNSGGLSIEKYRLLSVLDFSWDGQYEKWKRMFYRATEYISVHGTICNVSAREDLQLSQWIVLQRYLYKRGLLCDERVRRLQGINLILDPREDKFKRNIATLKAFREANGHGLIPRSIAPWADSLRRRWKDGKLSVRMYREYKRHGFCFQPHEYKLWVWMDKLRTFKMVHGHCYPNFLVVDDRPLYEWLQAQRRKQRNGTLQDTVETELVDMGVDFRPFRTVLREIISEMEKIERGEEEGIAPARVEEWKCLLREMGPKKLRKKDVARLEGIGFVF